MFNHRSLLTINLVVAAGYALFSPWGGYWSVFQALFGLVALLLPGANLMVILERISREQQEGVVRWLWVAMFSLVITPVVSVGIGKYINPSSIEPVATGFLVWWAAGIACLAVTGGLAATKARQATDAKPLLTLILIFCAAVIGAGIIYPFIPEADSYSYLIKLREYQGGSLSLAAEGRLGFVGLLQLFESITTISSYWLLKIGLPLAGVTFPVTTYLWSRQLISSKSARLLISLAPLYFPVIFQELLISRPQSVFLLCLAPALYVLGKLSLSRERSDIYWILSIVVMSALGLQTHTLFALLVILGLAAVFVYYWPRIKKQFLDSALITASLLLITYPWVAKTGLVGDIQNLSKLFFHSITNNPFRIWFLDNYRNVDGVEAGWSGIGAVFYYAYNLGVFLPGLIVLALLFRYRGAKPERNPFAPYWPAVATFVIFFFIAEVAPRFDLAFLPDRAWLLIASSLALLLPYLVSQVMRIRMGRLLINCLAILASLAILGNWTLTYLKDGWISAADYPASTYLQTSTPANSVILSQGGNHVLIRYFAARTMMRPLTDIFTTHDLDAVKNYLDVEHALVTEGVKVSRLRVSVIDSELEQLRRPVSPRQPEPPALEERIMILERERQAEVASQSQLRSAHPSSGRPVYILYSENKFRSFYSSRAWWRNSNFYGADLEKFSKTYPVVYNKDGVMIWKVQ